MKWYKIYDFVMDGVEPQALYSVRTVEVSKTLVCLGRLPDGYFAVSDKCPHASGRLGLGECTHEGKVVCPHHRYKYDMKTGSGKPEQGDYVETYIVETRNDGVWITLDKQKEKNIPWWKSIFRK